MCLASQLDKPAAPPKSPPTPAQLWPHLVARGPQHVNAPPTMNAPPVRQEQKLWITVGPTAIAK